MPYVHLKKSFHCPSLTDEILGVLNPPFLFIFKNKAMKA
jgi:hypothetical protein